MFAPALLPALLLHLGGGHASLHPAETNLFFEVPDIEAAIAAYEEAPLARFIRDEEVGEFLGSLLGQDAETIHLRALVDQGLQELRNEMSPVGVQMLDLVPEVDRVSMSLSGVELAGLTNELISANGGMSPALRARLRNVELRFVMDLASSEAATEAAGLIRAQAQVESGFDPNYGWQQTANGTSKDDPSHAWSVHALGGSSPALSFWIANEGPRLMIGFGLEKDTTQPPVRHLEHSLASDESYRTAGAALVGDKGVNVVNGYVAMDDLFELPRLLRVVPELPSEAAGVMEHVIGMIAPGGEILSRSRTHLVGSRFVTEEFEASFASEDAPRVFSREPMARDSFRMVPPDAVGVWASHLDKEGLSRLLMTTLGDLLGEDPEALLAQLEDDHGFRPDRDLLGAIGDEVVFYTLPFTGIGLPKVYLAVQLDDADAFGRGLERFGEYVAEISEGAIEFNARPYRKRPFMAFTPGVDLTELTANSGASGVADMLPVFLAVSMAVGVLEDRALISISGSYTKREMKRLMAANPEDKHQLQTAAEDLPGGIQSYGTTDWGAILAGVYDSARGFLPLIEQGGLELPFAIDSMPSSDVFREHFPPSTSWTREVDGGTYAYSESCFGPEIPFLFAAAGSIAGVVVFEEESMQGGVAYVGGEIPPPTTDVRAPSDVTTEHLRELKVAIVVYSADAGRYPASLEHLLQPTANFPGGFLDGNPLPQDGWGRAFRYSVSDDGASYQLWSLGPDGVDQGGQGDDLDLAR